MSEYFGATRTDIVLFVFVVSPTRSLCALGCVSHLCSHFKNYVSCRENVIVKHFSFSNGSMLEDIQALPGYLSLVLYRVRSLVSLSVLVP